MNRHPCTIQPGVKWRVFSETRNHPPVRPSCHEHVAQLLAGRGYGIRRLEDRQILEVAADRARVASGDGLRKDLAAGAQEDVEPETYLRRSGAEAGLRQHFLNLVED
jgi:hypothetical protein